VVFSLQKCRQASRLSNGRGPKLPCNGGLLSLERRAKTGGESRSDPNGGYGFFSD